MLKPFPLGRGAGFSLVELMIAITVMAILMAAAMPTYTTWVQNSQIRNAAESIQHGLQRARAEAVARNAQVAFVIGNGSFWTVSVVSTGDVIEQRPSGEVSQSVSMTVLPAPASAGDPSTSTLTFNGLGSVVANAVGGGSITQIDFDSTSLSAASSRELRLSISAGGGVRMCDPNVSSSTDPRYCY